MKWTLLFLMLISSLTAFTSERLLTPAQEKKVLRTIDDLCGDTWCEGDYNFRFNSFTCEKTTSTCELNFQFIKTDDEGEKETYSPEQVCRFENIKKFQQLMDGQWSLNEDFYSAVSECIWEKEKTVEF